MILKGLGLVAVGMLFGWLGFQGWKARREERISLIEAAILKATDEEPLPRTRFDEVIGTINSVMILLLGTVMILGGIGILSSLGE